MCPILVAWRGLTHHHRCMKLSVVVGQAGLHAGPCMATQDLDSWMAERLPSLCRLRCDPCRGLWYMLLGQLYSCSRRRACWGRTLICSRMFSQLRLSFKATSDWMSGSRRSCQKLLWVSIFHCFWKHLQSPWHALHHVIGRYVCVPQE